LCRSVHAEANAIISAARRDMIGATLYLVGRDARTRELLPDAMSCAMCKKLIINSGIKKVVIRVGEDRIKVVDVEDWIINDDSLFIKL
jgi:dCMP deaminase